jgi:large subunit ribosomal protein L30e
MDIAKELKVTLSTGKVEIGYKVGLKILGKKKAKAVVVSSNMPESLLARIQKEAVGVPLYKFPGSSWDLGGLCGKPFPVTTVAIMDAGESGILKPQEG